LEYLKLAKELKELIRKRNGLRNNPQSDRFLCNFDDFEGLIPSGPLKTINLSVNSQILIG